MEQMIIDDDNKKRIQRHIKKYSYKFKGYEQDIELLEKEGILTEELAKYVFSDVMEHAESIRGILAPKEDDEFAEQINDVYLKYDNIPKPEGFKENGHYSIMALQDISLEKIYENMQTAFDVIELFQNYYYCRDLRNISRNVIDSIDSIYKYHVDLRQDGVAELKEVQEKLQNLLSQKKTDVKSIQDLVNIYNRHALTIWNNYLTDVDDTKNDEYRWLVHNLTKGELQGEFRDKYMSTSLITNNTMGLCGNSHYGLIIKPKHIISASYEDTYTYNWSDDEENTFVIRPPIMLPHQIEDICIYQTIEANGETLNYDKSHIYSEIVVDDFKIEGIYYISNGEHELARDYERAKKVAEERGLPLIERDISKYRVEHGLEPMTEGMKKEFARNILDKCCSVDKELQGTYIDYDYYFVDAHFQEIYEQYIRLKEKGDYSIRDILQIFSEIAKDDMHFKKISQIFDIICLEYEASDLSDEEKEQLKLEYQYGVKKVSNREELKHKLEYVITEWNMCSANKFSQNAQKKIEDISTVFPQFEEFKEIYLKLMQSGLTDKLYECIDYDNVNYLYILEEAKKIIEEYERKKEQDESQERKEDSDSKKEDVVSIKEDDSQFQSIIGESETIEEETEDESAQYIGDEFHSEENNLQIGETNSIEENIQTGDTSDIQDSMQYSEDGEEAEINEFGEIIRFGGKEIGEDEESVDDGTIDNNPINKTEMQSINLWMDRFRNWYNVIDRVSQKVGDKLKKMRLDIIKSIKRKLKIKEAKKDTKEK